MNRYVCFQVGQVRYALALARIAQVLRFERVNPVPMAPPFVEGIINLGGEVVPVINLRTRFGLERLEPAPRSRVLIAEAGGRKYGLLVDGVKEILELEESSIAAAATAAFGVKAELIAGIAKVQEDIVILLDLERLLAGEAGEIE